MQANVEKEELVAQQRQLLNCSFELTIGTNITPERLF